MNAFMDANSSDHRGSFHRGLIAHLIVVTHFVQKVTLDKLVAGRGYAKLSLAYYGYILLLAEADHQPGELAAKLGISKQACSKSVRELEAIELIARRGNPEDSRSSLLSLSARGRQLLQDGIEVTAETYQQFAVDVDAKRTRQLIELLEELCRDQGIDLTGFSALDAAGKPVADSRVRLSLLMFRLTASFRQALFDALNAREFKGLKPSYGQVLGLLHSEERRIQYIASIIGVSKQAIAATALDLEQAGYITRHQDQDDRRQIVLSLSPLGRRLLSESVASVRVLEASIRQRLGDANYRLLDDTLSAMYLQVAEHHDRSNVLPARIQQLSEQLLAELGTAGVRSLARHLMTITRGDS